MVQIENGHISPTWGYEGEWGTDPVVIPEGVVSIGQNAFGGDYTYVKIRSVTFPESLKKIATCAFLQNKTLRKIVLSPNVTRIEPWTFSGCTALEEIVFSEGLTTISHDAFRDCTSLQTLHLPESLKKIGATAFLGCNQLETVHFPKNLQDIDLSAFRNTPWYEKMLENPPEFLKLGENLLLRYHGTAEEVTIPEGITIICANAFSKAKHLQSVRIPEGVTEIQDSAFSECSNLREIHLPKTLKKIGKSAFSRCVSLEEIHLPDKVTSIGLNAFRNCSSLKKAILSDKITTLTGKPGIGIFADCTALEEVHLPKKLKTLGDSTFDDCKSLRSLTLPENLQSIGLYAFSGCGLETLHIPASVKSLPENFHIGDALEAFSVAAENPVYHDFDGCLYKTETKSLMHVPAMKNSLQIEPGTETIYAGSMYQCNFRELTLPESVKSFGYQRFKQPVSVSIAVPDGFVHLGKLEQWEDAANCRRLLQMLHEPETVDCEQEFKSLSTSFKRSYALYKAVLHPEEEFYTGYCKRTAKALGKLCIDENDIENMELLIALGYVHMKNIDSLIDYAIDKQQLEIQNYLIHWKNAHTSDDVESELNKRFRL